MIRNAESSIDGIQVLHNKRLKTKCLLILLFRKHSFSTHPCINGSIIVSTWRLELKDTSDLIGDSLDTIPKSLAPYWSDFLVYQWLGGLTYTPLNSSIWFISPQIQQLRRSVWALNEKGPERPHVECSWARHWFCHNFGTKGHAKCRRTSTAVIAEEILVRGSDKTPAYI